MKIVFLATLTLLTFASRGQSSEKSKVEPGIYKLYAQKYSDGQTDTIFSGFELIKMYTPAYYEFVTLWNNGQVEFGIASYTQSHGHLAQHWFYTVWKMDTVMDMTVETTFTDSGYNQMLRNLPYKGKMLTLAEAYSTVSATGISDLDGAWKVNKSMLLKSGDTTINKVVKYKLFQKGHYVFFHHTTTDSVTNKFTNGIGYGKFKLVDKSLTEDNELSNIYGHEGHKTLSIISFNGKDQFTQETIDSTNDNKYIETYTRLK